MTTSLAPFEETSVEIAPPPPVATTHVLPPEAASPDVHLTDEDIDDVVGVRQYCIAMNHFFSGFAAGRSATVEDDS